MSPIVYAIPVFLLSVLIEALIVSRVRKGGYDLADALGSLNFGVMSQLAGAGTKLLSFGIYVAVYHFARVVTWPETSLAVGIVALVFYDFCYYWAHRMGHEVAVLWAAHVVHHSSEYFNLSTALRQTATGALFGWIFYMPMAILGVSPTLFLIVGLIDLLYQYWVHTELIGRLGWLDRVLVTPSNHRVHHGQNDYCLDRNYGGILILWDRLFGTFVDERAEERILYGVRTPLRAYNPIWGNLHVYADLWRCSAQAHGIKSKLAVWLGPPGGGGKAPAPWDRNAFTRFGAKSSKGVRFYVVAQYAIGNLALVAFLIQAGVMSGVEALAWGALIAVGLLTQGVLLEGATWARPAETARLVLVGVALAVAPRVMGSALAVSWRVTLILVAGLSMTVLWRLQSTPTTTPETVGLAR